MAGFILEYMAGFIGTHTYDEAAVAIFERLSQLDDSGKAAHNLVVALQLVGIDLRKLGRLDEAFVDYNNALAIVRRNAGAHPDRPDTRNALENAAGTMGGLAFELLLAKKFEKSLDASNQATAAAPGLVWLYAHRAHALMFLGRVEEARALYLAHRGEKIQGNMIWEDVIREEFAVLRKAKLTNPLMAEIETDFAKPAVLILQNE